MVKSFVASQSTCKLRSSFMASHPKIVRPVERFNLKSSSEFASRSSNVFNSLNSLENRHQTWISHNEVHESFDEGVTIEEAEKPALFKKPFAPPNIKRISHHRKRNMKKWIKYSLADVPLSSDATNSAVAFQFLNELQKRKEKAEESFVDGKITFCKPKKGFKNVNTVVQSVVTSTTADVDEDLSDDFNHSSGGDANKKSMASNVKLMHLDEEFDE